MRSQRVAFLVVVFSFLLLPAAAWAQSGITGVIRDSSGGVLPGVTVEASSPALIEGSRTAVSDGEGLYTVTDLRPGTYMITFTLAGFRTFVRDGVVLPAQFTATVNAEMAVGALEESITVSGEAPIVDIRSTRAQTQYSDETLSSLPGSGRITTMINALPGATLTSEADRAGGGLSDRAQTRFSVHGAPGAAPVVDGMNNELAAANTGVYVYNQLTLQEVVAETSGVGADRDTGGAQLNMIPKEGGNLFSGTAVIAATGPDFESSNSKDNQELIDRGLDQAGAASLKKYYDGGASFGGPIQRDKLWFFGATRKGVTQQYAAGIYFNKLRQPESFLYEKDLSRPGYSNDFYRDYSLRLTWQAAEKHKIAISSSFQHNCNCVYALFRPQGGTTLLTPEASTAHAYEPDYNSFVTWTYPATNRVLFTFAGGMNHITQTNYRGYDDEIFDMVTNQSIQITEQVGDYRYGAAYGATAGGSSYSTISRRQYHQQASMSYVTGSHNVKVGGAIREFRTGDHDKYGNDLYMANMAIAYRMNNQRPDQLTLYATPQHFEEAGNDIALYAQDQWTIKKLTMNLGVRYNNIDTSAPDQVLPAGFYVAERRLEGKEHIPNYTNFYPRLGAAYDLFGTGRTAIKASYGTYADIVRATTGNPANDMSLTTNRSWNDQTFGANDPRSGNFFPDCDQFNPNVNGECGNFSDRNFGKPIVSTLRSEDAQTGFNQQYNNSQASLSVQHELTNGVGVNVGWFRTWYNGFLATDVQGADAADYDKFCFTAPVDSRLGPNSGKQICELYDIKPALFGTTTNLVDRGTTYGKQTSVYNGYDFTVNARFGRGGQASGGVSTSQTVTNNCEFNSRPDVSPQGFTAGTSRSDSYCEVAPPWAAGTQLKFLIVYPLPYDIQTSVIYQNVPGVAITASYQVPNAVAIAGGLGHNLSSCPNQTAACGQSYTTALIPANSMFEPRLNQFDLRFSKLFSLGGTKRVRGNFDVYNLFNTSAVLSMVTAYGTNGASWQNVGQLLSGRLIKFGAQFDF